MPVPETCILIQHLENDYELYKQRLLENSVEDVFDASYHTALMYELLCYLIQPCDDSYLIFASYPSLAKSLASSEHPLEELYEEWISADGNILPDVVVMLENLENSCHTSEFGG